MRIQGWWVASLGMIGVFLGGSDTIAAESHSPRDVLNLAAKINRLIENQWTAKGAKPGQNADDAEFLRRIYLDLAGRIPYTSEIRDFLDDKRSDKRLRVVDRLLKSPSYLNHFTNVLRSVMLPASNNQFNGFSANFDPWLRDNLRRNVGYDKMVRELVTLNVRQPNAMGGRPRQARTVPRPTPIGFYQANEFKPENLAASLSRVFLGVKLECAQCHDHPFNSYTRVQFWELASFFTNIQQPVRGKQQAKVLKIPGTSKLVTPKFLDGGEPQAKRSSEYRKVLADWMVKADNPYFAKAAVNRLWAHMFGIGILDPVDEPGDDNPPSHPELLAELAKEFIAHKYDVKFIIKALAASKAYQLTSALNHATQNDARVFARMPIKGLTAEQLFDSLVVATGYRESQANQRAIQQFNQLTPRADFIAKFSNQDKRTEMQTSILQALALMNGKFIADATSVKDSVRLASIIDFPFFDTPAKKIEAMFLTTLSRRPRASELDFLAKYVQSGGPRKDEKTALTDVFWALLNSSEFILNH